VRVLFVGPLSRWSTTEARRRALFALGHEVSSFDVLQFVPASRDVLAKFQRQLHFGAGVEELNRCLVELAAEISPDLIWLDLPLQVYPRTLRALKNLSGKLVAWNSEYVGYRRYWFRHYLEAVSLYDAHVLTNRLTAKILVGKGARRIVMTEFAYDPEIHRPIELSDADRSRWRTQAVFVGHWEPTTERLISALKDAEIEVQVYGVNWHRARTLSERRSIQPAYGEDYVRAIAASDISLGFLSHWNRNELTVRSFEIPAIGGFLLAQRTPAHAALYEEGVEAEFFDGPTELVEKARVYLDHPADRRAIAQRGHERVTRSGHTYTDEMRRLLVAIDD
jgi:hypothetical protein